MNRVGGDQDFTNPYYYQKKIGSKFNPKDFSSFKYLSLCNNKVFHSDK